MEFDAGAIVSTVQNYILAIAGAGVALLGLTIGLSAAWRYAKRFLKG
ncbi:major coat protein [Thermus phage phiOH16]|nr:major coat protein [Thermus phage phiOH16]